MGLSGKIPPSAQRLGLHMICDATFSLENSCAKDRNIINISYISHLFNKILTVYKIGRLLECVPLCEVEEDMDRPLILTEGARQCNTVLLKGNYIGNINDHM